MLVKNNGTPIRKIRYNIEKNPAMFTEYHIGEKTFNKSLYTKFVRIAKRIKAKNFISGDILNADDLRDKGTLTDECIFDQIYEFGRRFRDIPIQLIMQQNHGSRMFNRQLPRQMAETICDKWASVLGDVQNRNPDCTILDPDEGFVEIEFVDNAGKVLKKVLLFHPIGVSSPNAWNNKLMQSFSGYDAVYCFHFHKKEYREQVKRRFGNMMEITDVYFIPPFIGDPRYGINKGYPPIHTGFLLVKYDKQLKEITETVVHCND